MPMELGGMALNDSVPEEVIAFLATARAAIEASRGSAYESFTAVSCASQVVAGTKLALECIEIASHIEFFP